MCSFSRASFSTRSGTAWLRLATSSCSYSVCSCASRTRSVSIALNSRRASCETRTW